MQYLAHNHIYWIAFGRRLSSGFPFSLSDCTDYYRKKALKSDVWLSVRNRLPSTLIEEQAPATYECIVCQQKHVNIIHCLKCGPHSYFCEVRILLTKTCLLCCPVILWIHDVYIFNMAGTCYWTSFANGTSPPAAVECGGTVSSEFSSLVFCNSLFVDRDWLTSRSNIRNWYLTDVVLMGIIVPACNHLTCLLLMKQVFHFFYKQKLTHSTHHHAVWSIVFSYGREVVGIVPIGLPCWMSI